MKKKRIKEHKIGMYLGGRIDWDPDFVRRKLPPAKYGTRRRTQQDSEPEKSGSSSNESA